jgi:hypothetical protein
VFVCYSFHLVQAKQPYVPFSSIQQLAFSSVLNSGNNREKVILPGLMFACSLQILALLFLLRDSVPDSVEDGVAGFAILLLEDAVSMGNGGRKTGPPRQR